MVLTTARFGRVLTKRRDEQAIEARGSSGPSDTHQVVFDVNTGEMRAEPVAGDGSGGSAGSAADAAAGTVEDDESEPEPEPLDPEREAVIEKLQGTNVNEVPPIELMAKVQEWQDRLDE